MTTYPPLRETIRPTTIVEASRLAARLDIDLFLATETFQHTGSFKFRAAFNVASSVEANQIITASSGNFGQAMAYACRLLGKSSIIVMPNTSAQVKVDAVREFGGVVDLIDIAAISRADRVAELAAEHPDAYVASAYDDPLVIEGNSTLGEELCALSKPFDTIIAPVGGGGLLSGILTGVQGSGRTIEVIGAEPLLANDAAESLRLGRLVVNDAEPQTIADGARTVSLGYHNWRIIRERIAGIVEVPEERIREAVCLLFSLANLKVEPTGALSIGALLTEPERFAGRSVCCVVSGGNVDPAVYRALLE
jgi:threonine dehydratase